MGFLFVYILRPYAVVIFTYFHRWQVDMFRTAVTVHGKYSGSRPAANCREQSPSQKLVKKFATFYGARSLFAVFTEVNHWSLSRVTLNLSTSFHALSLRSILILSSYVRLALPSGIVFSLQVVPSKRSLKVVIIRLILINS